MGGSKGALTQQRQFLLLILLVKRIVLIGSLACMHMHLYHLGLTRISLCSCRTAPRAPLKGRDILAESIDDCGDIIVRLVK